MPIRCVCPNGHALRVKDKLAGKRGTCPTCQAEFVVPAMAETGVPTPPGSPQAASAGPPPIPPTSAPTPRQPAQESVEWRFARADGEQFGPTVPTVFAQWITAGRVSPDDLVWRSGWPDWRRADADNADLPAPLPSVEAPPPAPTPGVTLPPPIPTAAVEPVAPTVAKPGGKQNTYLLHRKQKAKRRRTYTIALAVFCVALAVMLVVLTLYGPPAGAPVIPQ